MPWIFISISVMEPAGTSQYISGAPIPLFRKGLVFGAWGKACFYLQARLWLTLGGLCSPRPADTPVSLRLDPTDESSGNFYLHKSFIREKGRAPGTCLVFTSLNLELSMWELWQVGAILLNQSIVPCKSMAGGRFWQWQLRHHI